MSSAWSRTLIGIAWLGLGAWSCFRAAQGVWTLGSYIAAVVAFGLGLFWILNRNRDFNVRSRHD